MLTTQALKVFQKLSPRRIARTAQIVATTQKASAINTRMENAIVSMETDTPSALSQSAATRVAPDDRCDRKRASTSPPGMHHPPGEAPRRGVFLRRPG